MPPLGAASTVSGPTGAGSRESRTSQAWPRSRSPDRVHGSSVGLDAAEGARIALLRAPRRAAPRAARGGARRRRGAVRPVRGGARPARSRVVAPGPRRGRVDLAHHVRGPRRGRRRRASRRTSRTASRTASRISRDGLALVRRATHRRAGCRRLRPAGPVLPRIDRGQKGCRQSVWFIVSSPGCHVSGGWTRGRAETLAD